MRRMFCNFSAKREARSLHLVICVWQMNLANSSDEGVKGVGDGGDILHQGVKLNFNYFFVETIFGEKCMRATAPILCMH